MEEDDVSSLETFIASLARAYDLTAPEERLVLDLAIAHDLAQQLLGDVLERALHQGVDEPGPEIFQAATPGILDALQQEVLPHQSELPLLAEPRVASACATAMLGPHNSSLLGLQLLVQALRPMVSRRAVATVEWLDGRAMEQAGFGLEAEAAFERAVSLDPAWPPALESLAGVAFDRGDTERALGLLDRAGIGPDDGMYQLLLSYRTPEVISPRRNDPCWCGSGRKLKQCHRQADRLPLARRAPWLYHKASAFLQDGPWRAELLELARERTRYSDDLSDLYAALTDQVVLSAMLVEGGVFHDFIEARGPLLPADELALVRRWATTRRGLFEVEEIELGVGLHVRNVLDGERFFVREVIGSREVHPGAFFVSLALPVDDDDFNFFGGVEPVSLTQRAEVIDLLDSDPEPLDVVARLTDGYAPTRVTTTDGDPLEHCTVVLKVKGRKLIDRAFDKQFTRSDDSSWVASPTGAAVGDGESIGGILNVSGRQVTVTAMSRARADTLLAAMTGLGLEFDILEASVVDMTQALHERRASDAPALPPDSPEMAEVLERVILQYEVDWLDTSIPALEGRTPREAAADPSARPDLIALIHSFPAGTPGTMDRERLRAALDL